MNLFILKLTISVLVTLILVKLLKIFQTSVSFSVSTSSSYRTFQYVCARKRCELCIKLIAEDKLQYTILFLFFIEYLKILVHQKYESVYGQVIRIPNGIAVLLLFTQLLRVTTGTCFPSFRGPRFLLVFNFNTKQRYFSDNWT